MLQDNVHNCNIYLNKFYWLWALLMSCLSSYTIEHHYQLLNTHTWVASVVLHVNIRGTVNFILINDVVCFTLEVKKEGAIFKVENNLVCCERKMIYDGVVWCRLRGIEHSEARFWINNANECVLVCLYDRLPSYCSYYGGNAHSHHFWKPENGNWLGVVIKWMVCGFGWN